jgi:hypothetical protein
MRVAMHVRTGPVAESRSWVARSLDEVSVSFTLWP